MDGREERGRASRGRGNERRGNDRHEATAAPETTTGPADRASQRRKRAVVHLSSQWEKEREDRRPLKIGKKKKKEV